MTSIKAEVLDKSGMTPREAEVMARVCEGLSNKDIARRLGLALRTVEYYLEILYQKNCLTAESINRRTTLIVTVIAKGVVKITLNSCLLIICAQMAMSNDPAALRNNRIRTVHRAVSRRL